MAEQEKEQAAAGGETVEAGGDLLGSIIEGRHWNFAVARCFLHVAVAAA